MIFLDARLGFYNLKLDDVEKQLLNIMDIYIFIYIYM